MDNGGASSDSFDLLIVGGGVHGAALCREAALAGVRPLLVEKADYCSGSSGNSMRTIHGGIRHLQSLDLANLVESMRAQRDFARGYPAAIRPLPCLLPAEPSLTKNALTLGLGAFAYNQVARLLGGGVFGRGRLVSGAELAGQMDHVRSRAAARALQWWDGQVVDPEGLIMEMLSEAVLAGAVTWNYSEVRALKAVDGGYRAEIEGAGGGGEVQARWVVDCTGTGGVVQGLLTGDPPVVGGCARAVNLVIRASRSGDRSYGGNEAVGGEYAGHGVAMKAGGDASRSLFVVPWRKFYIVGTWYFAAPVAGWGGAPDGALSERELGVCLEESSSILAGGIDRGDVLAAHVGRLPLRPASGEPQGRLLKRARIEQIHGDARSGAYRVCSAKFTEALRTARRMLATLQRRRLSGAPRPADAPSSGSYLARTFPARNRRMTALANGCHGEDHSDNLTPFTESEIAFSVAAEDVRHLADLALRRLPNHAVLERPEALEYLAGRLGRARGWSKQTLETEIERCRQELRKLPDQISPPLAQRDGPGSASGSAGYPGSSER